MPYPIRKSLRSRDYIQRKSHWVILVIPLLFIVLNANAANTGGVFGPSVKEGHKSAQYRVVSAKDADVLAQRLHFQQSINGDVMMRIVAQARTTDQENNDFDFAQAELLWQLSKDKNPYQYGLRFDLRKRDEERSDRVGLHFPNQIRINDKVSVRLVLLSFKEFGDNAKDGVILQTRERISYKLNTQVGLGIDIYSSYGTTDEFKSFDDQQHQVGPFANFRFGDNNGWIVSPSVLFGATDATEDLTSRLYLGRKF